MTALADRIGTVRSAAAEALIAFKDPATVPPLVALLRDPEPQVRFSAVGALWHIGHPSALGAALTVALQDPDPTTRKRAVQALGDLADEPVVPTLLRLARIDNAVRLEAALSVAKIKPQESVQPLLAIVLDDPVEGEEALAILGDVFMVAAPKLHPDDLKALVDLPTQLEAAGRSSGVKRTALDTVAVVKAATEELIRRGLLTRTAAAKTERGERRIWPRRAVKKGDVQIFSARHLSKPDRGRVFDISSRGLGVIAGRPFSAGEMLNVRLLNTDEEDPGIVLEVRHCSATKSGYQLGCKAVQMLSDVVLSRFV